MIAQGISVPLKQQRIFRVSLDLKGPNVRISMLEVSERYDMF